MKEYIEREALMAYAYQQPSGFISDLSIQFFPAADVVERKRGEWIDTGFENSTGKIYLCSACNKANNPNKKDVEMGRAKETPDFCPNCGSQNGGYDEESNSNL